MKRYDTTPQAGKKFSDFWKPNERVMDLAAGLPSGSHILDMGSADGREALALAELGHQVTALDQSPQMIARLRTTATSRDLTMALIEGNMLDFPEGEQFDLVISKMVLHFLPDAQAVSRGLSILKTATAPGGSLYLQAFTTASSSGGRTYLFEPGEMARSLAEWDNVSTKTVSVWGYWSGDDEARELISEVVIARKSK